MEHLKIRCFETLKASLVHASRPICLYSGGLDSTYLLYFLAQLGRSDVIALTVDVGGDLDIESVRSVARTLDAHSVILDKQHEFADQFVVPAIAAQATYLNGHPICASLSRPLVAKAACDLAKKEGSHVIIHTSNPSQNSLRRFNGALSSLEFDGSFGSPFDLNAIPREEKMKVLSGAGVELKDKLYSIDSNLWGREFEYGDLDDPEHCLVPEHLFRWSQLCHTADKTPVSITFDSGVPTALNGEPTDFVSLVNRLNIIVGSYGLGRFIGLEEIEGGAKVQEIREMPAAYLLLDAYRRLETACMSAECIRQKLQIEQLWVREAVEGRWYGRLREAAQAFIKSMAGQITGEVSYELGARNLQVSSVRASHPLYIRERKKFEEALRDLS